MDLLVLALLLAVIAVASVRAFRDEHLIVIRGRRGGWVLLARVAGPRYHVISVLGVPLAVLHYSGSVAGEALAGLRARLVPQRRASSVAAVRIEA